MNVTAFEAALLANNCYLINPSLFVPEGTATYCTPEELIEKVFVNDADKLSKCVRRRSEQMGAMTYYIRELNGWGYFRIVVPTGTGAWNLIDLTAVHFKLKQICDTLAVRLGFA